MPRAKMPSQKELMDKLRKFWKRNPRMTPMMIAIWDKHWLKLSRMNKELLMRELMPKGNEVKHA